MPRNGRFNGRAFRLPSMTTTNVSERALPPAPPKDEGPTKMTVPVSQRFKERQRRAHPSRWHRPWRVPHMFKAYEMQGLGTYEPENVAIEGFGTYEPETVAIGRCDGCDGGIGCPDCPYFTVGQNVSLLKWAKYAAIGFAAYYAYVAVSRSKRKRS